MPNFDPPARKSELAFISYLMANRAPLAPIAELPWFPLAGNQIKQYPRGIAECKSCTEHHRFGGRGIYDATLSLWIVSNAENDDDKVHEARIGAVIALINDRQAVKQTLNAPPTGQSDTREVKDFHIFQYSGRKMDSGRSDNKWVGEVELHLVCQGKDVPRP